jgi:peptidoglycan/LPS O-acetylase OafA/YrhL
MLPVAASGRFEGTRDYLRRRVARLLPVYYLSLLVIVLIGGYIRPAWGQSYPHGPLAVLVQATFLQEIVYPGRVGLGVNLVVWSMTIAACFYAMFPLVVRWYLRHPWLGLAIGIGISIGWRLATDSRDVWFQQYPLFVADFACGMTAVCAYVKVRRRGIAGTRGPLTVMAIGIPVFLVLLYLVGHGVVYEHQVPRHEHLLVAIAVPAVFALLISTVPFLPAWAQSPLDNPVSRWIGRISFSLFMFHFIAIYTVIKVFGLSTDGTMRSVAVLIATAIPLSFAVGWLVTRYFEEPLRARMRRRAAPAAEAAGAVDAISALEPSGSASPVLAPPG